jgi:hypothetical protein
MAQGKTLKSLSATKVTIFKITNRKGYAAICMNNLTEGSTALQAYDRMGKALKRMGYALKDLSASDIKKIVRPTK